MILGHFLTLENMVEKFFRNSNFSDFLRINVEINQFVVTGLGMTHTDMSICSVNFG